MAASSIFSNLAVELEAGGGARLAGASGTTDSGTGASEAGLMVTAFFTFALAPMDAAALVPEETKRQLVAMPGVSEASILSEWPSGELVTGTPDQNRRACLGIKREGEVQHGAAQP